MEVQILEVCKVSPLPDSPTDIYLSLSFFDLLWLRFPPVEIILFYEGTFSLSIIPKLKHSLSQTLEHYFPLAGYLSWPSSSPNPIIRYQKGDGVLFSVAKSDGDFSHLSRSSLRETSSFHPLIAQLIETDSKVPLLAIKVTLFPNEGCCIGITFHHAVSDSNAFPALLKLWSSFCKFGNSTNLSSQLRPTFDRKIIRERYKELEELYIRQLLEQGGGNSRKLPVYESGPQPDKVRGTFQLSGSNVKKLKEFIRARLGNQEHNIDITTFSVTLAHLIVCLAKAKGRTDNKVCFSIPVNCRNRLEPPVSPNYAGNCVSFPGGEIEENKLMGDDGIIAAMDAVYRTIKSLDDGVLKGAENWLLAPKIETGKISIYGSTKLDLYDIDFGWGRPRKLDVTSIDKTGATSLMLGINGEIEIELSLKKQEMEKFAYEFAAGLSKMGHKLSAL